MNLTDRPARAALALLLCALLAACGGGGGGGSTTATPVVTATSSAANAAATFSLTIPFAATSSSAAARAPQNVSPGTKSFVVALTSVNGVASTTSVETDLTSSACTATTTGTTCTVQIVAPAGTDIFAITLYAGTGATGAVLGSATAPATIVANGSNRIALAVNGVVAALHVFLTSTGGVLGTAQTSTAYVVALDATGAEILLPGSYTAPITVTSSDSTGHVLLAVNGGTPAASVQLNSPQDVLTVVFNGTGSEHAVTIAATATGATSASAAYTITGVLAALHVYLSSTSGVLGTPQTSAASVVAVDATGAQLTAPYPTPITVTSSDATGHVLVAVNGGTPAASVQLNSPQDALTIVFNGTGNAQAVSIAATASGATSSAAAYIVTGSPPVLSPASVTFTQLGSGGTQSVTITGGVAPYFVNGTTTSSGSPAISYSVSGATITLTANGAASQTFTISDSLGQTALLPVTSSTLTVPIQ